VSLHLSLSVEEHEALVRTAGREGRTVEEVARAAISDYTTGWRRERELLVDAVLAEDATLVHRLVSA
jgi:hypothetical protein